MLTERLVERQTESREIGRHRQRQWGQRQETETQPQRDRDRQTERDLNMQRPRETGIHTDVRHKADIWGDTCQT